MCVIVIVQDVRPTEDQIRGCFQTNPDGAGFAWRENGKVKWLKGIVDVDYCQQMVKDLPLPYIAHFRIASVGGKSTSLTHPFPLEMQVPLELKGEIDGQVLFHNGHWSKWKDALIEAAILGVKIPRGEMSDTRVMAWLAARGGIGIFENAIEEKVVIFGNQRTDIFPKFGWYKKEVGGGTLWFSNLIWETKGYQQFFGNETSEYVRTMCRHTRCASHFIDEEGWCPQHAPNGWKGVAKGSTVIDAKTTVLGSASGNEPSETPFQRAIKLFKEGKLSKNKLKQARREWDREQSKLRLVSSKATPTIVN